MPVLPPCSTISRNSYALPVPTNHYYLPPLAHGRAQLANTTCTPRSTIVAHGYMHACVNESFLDTYLTAKHSGADALRLQTSYLQLQATAMV